VLTGSIIRAMSTHYPHLGRTSETSISYYETKRGNISEGCHLHTRSQVSFENDYKFLERTNRNEVIKLYIVEGRPFSIFSSKTVLFPCTSETTEHD
jgi:hypothetical protein